MEASPDLLQQSQPPPEGPSGPAAPGSSCAWRRGQLVRVRGDRWCVEGGQVFPDCQLLHLAGISRTSRGRRLALLCPFDRPQQLDPSAALRRIGWRRWLHAFRALVAGATPHGRLRSAAAARIDLHAYQLEPALAVLNGLATRLLIADEVGLGKTIQAGLIVSELRAREQAARTLILTPAGLRDQWAWELRERFSIEATVVDAALLRRTLAQIAAGTNPWSIWPVIVASLDFVKRPDVLRALDPFTWDALLVDEAHLCASAPERSAAVQRLALRARRVVLLTATPHAGDDQAFRALCSIGQIRSGDSGAPHPSRAGRPTTNDPPTLAGGELRRGLAEAARTRTAAKAGPDQGPATSDQILMFRRGRPDVGLAHDRRVRLLRVRCSEDERRMHRLLERYTRAVWTSAEATSDGRLAMIVLRKRALSSAVSLARSLERRLEALFDVRPSGTQPSLPFAGDAEPDEQTPEDDEPVGYLAAAGMEGRREHQWLNCVLDAARQAAQHESKIARLSRLLVRAREPVVIFTEYRDTARWLTAALEALGPIVLLHGGLSRIERQDVERRFRTGAANLLVATDAAGEGLNLHHRCRLVVNLELPWNPMRLEQRIGRVDRLGQTRRPHAIHLVAHGTAEEHIVRRLVVRQERARLSVGGISDAVGAPREEDVAAAVMGDRTSWGKLPNRGIGVLPAKNPPDPFSMDEVNRLRFIRELAASPATRLRSRWHPADPLGACFTILPRRRAHRCRLASGLLCIFVVRLMDAQGDSLDESIVALRLDLMQPPADISRPVLSALVRSHALKEHALATRSQQLESAIALHQKVVAAAIEREHALAAIERHSSRPLQPGMFDRRALVEAERECAERRSRESERSERLFVLEADPSRSLVAQAELALVLVINQ